MCSSVGSKDSAGKSAVLCETLVEHNHWTLTSFLSGRTLRSIGTQPAARVLFLDLFRGHSGDYGSWRYGGATLQHSIGNIGLESVVGAAVEFCGQLTGCSSRAMSGTRFNVPLQDTPTTGLVMTGISGAVSRDGRELNDAYLLER